jgi:hypothetical protein
MERLSDFKPLERVALPEIGDLRCSGLILVVGPNSSGKTQFLQDLHQRLCGQPRALVVATDIRIRIPENYDSFIQCLESEGYFETIVDDGGNEQWIPRTTFLGSGQPVNPVARSQAQGWHGSYVQTTDPKERRASEYLNYFGRLLVTALFLERRLVALNQVAVIDFQNQPPQHDLHALYLDDSAKQHLFDEILGSFEKAVWPDASRGNSVCLRVSDEGARPTAEDWRSPKKLMAFRSIETEGDGLKSYVATCVALLLGLRPVCLIDEPEMCLHPPQAYNLGRFIGRYGASTNTVTLVATHSSQVLRGVIQRTQAIQIVRLTRREKNFSAHLVPAEILSEAVAKPTVRAESVLDGIFAESVVVLEADGDRLVYQSVWETLSDEVRLDVHFCTVGGTGGIADTCKLYRALKIPVAVIADLDLITDPSALRRVLDVMTTPDLASSITNRAKAVMETIKQLPPTVEIEEFRQTLRGLVPEGANWQGEQDIVVRKGLSALSQRLDRMRRLKRGGPPR